MNRSIDADGECNLRLDGEKTVFGLFLRGPQGFMIKPDLTEWLSSFSLNSIQKSCLLAVSQHKDQRDFWFRSSEGTQTNSCALSGESSLSTIHLTNSCLACDSYWEFSLPWSRRIHWLCSDSAIRWLHATISLIQLMAIPFNCSGLKAQLSWFWANTEHSCDKRQSDLARLAN